MNNGSSVSVLTGAIVGNTINTLKLVLKLCEMKRWTSTVLVLSFLTLVLLSCVAVLLVVGEPPEIDDDVPLHPIASSAYPNSSTKSSRSNANQHDHHEHDHNDKYHSHNHRHQNEIVYHDNHSQQLHEQPRHNYRKRFTDAIKGVFSDLITSNRNSSSLSSTLSSPTFEEHLPLQPINSSSSNNDKHDDEVVESFENNSSRLKRQLDFGSGASSEENSKETFETTQPSAKKYAPPSSRRPFVRVIKLGGVSTPRSTVAPSSSSSSLSPSSSSPSPQPQQQTSSSSEEIANSSEEPTRNRGGKYRKTIQRFRNNKANRKPKLQILSSKEKYDVSKEDSPEPRKNFTLEVVQVERKVVRKEDSHIPPLFKKGNYNIEPRLLKVSKKEDANRPQVVYKKASRTSASPPVINKASNRQGQRSSSPEISKESISIEASVEKSDDDEKQPVVVNLNQQIPINDHDLSAEDLKDYHDGHSTFGSKGNFTHTIISRNVAGFVPNSKEEISKNRKSDRTIVIEKGKVTERYPQNPFDNASPEIYSVPGGRSSSTENYSPKHENFPFTRTERVRGGGNSREAKAKNNDRTSPAITTTLEELYKKGHPGVVPAPKQNRQGRYPDFAEPYGESADYSSPFRYNPLVDDPPLKFDPESDRFYGEPIPDNKERVAQSNSPEHDVVNRSGEDEPRQEDFFKPAKRDSSSEEDKPQVAAVEEPENSRERNGSPDNFNFGRAYNPPDYASEYDTEPAGDGDGDNNRSVGDVDNFDFSALEDNFGPSHDDERRTNDAIGDDVPSDFFDFPEGIGGIGGGRGGEARFKPRANSEERGDDDNVRGSSKEDREVERDHNDFDEGTEVPERRRPPPPRRAPEVDYETNNDFGFGPIPRKDAVEDDDGHPRDIYDNGFIHTLKQFDEEIKKLQDEERQKLLHSTALPSNTEQEQSTEHNEPLAPSSTPSGYKKDPPLIITSPGPLEHSHEASPGDFPPPPPLSTTIRVTDDDHDEKDHPTEGNPFISREPTESTESQEDIGDATVPNRSLGAEEDDDEEQGTTQGHRGFGPNDYSTERSGEVDEKK